MAEFAQKGIEEMLFEVEKMRKVGIFSTEETRAIMKKRKRFEYKMQRRTKEKEVYLQYIQYEISVLKLIKLRREKKGIEVDKDVIEKPIALRIYKLFRIACMRFKDDIKLWLTHIDFAKKNLDKDRVSKLYTSLLQIHNKKPNLWIMAAKFEFEMNESIESSRSIFQRALRFLPNETKLWIEYFKMELMCVELIMKRKELLGIDEKEDSEKQITDAILTCKIVDVVFQNAIKSVQENIPKFVYSLIQIANEFNFTNNLIESMYKFVENDPTLNKCEDSWDVLARRNLLEESNILKKCQETGQVADFTIAEFEEKAVEVYQKALETMPSEKMHHIYIQFCVERLKIDSKFLNEERFARLNVVLKKTQTLFSLSLDLITQWIDYLIKFNHTKEAVILIEDQLKTNKKCLNLWSFYLRIKIEQTNETNQNDLIDLFYKAINSVKQKEQLNLWKLIVNWCLLNNYEKTEKILLEGSQIMYLDIASFVRSKYFTWALQSDLNQKDNLNSLEKVRKIYDRLCNVPPFDSQFYLRYIEIEKCASKVDNERILNCYEDALKHFSKHNIDLWLSYIEFKNSKSNLQQDVSNIYWRAMKNLDTDLIEDFTQKFCLSKIEIENSQQKNEIEMSE